MRIAAVMAVHHCRALPLARLDSLRTQHVLSGTLDMFVLDDAALMARLRPFGRRRARAGTAASPPANGGRAA